MASTSSQTQVFETKSDFFPGGNGDIVSCHSLYIISIKFLFQVSHPRPWKEAMQKCMIAWIIVTEKKEFLQEGSGCRPPLVRKSGSNWVFCSSKNKPGLFGLLIGLLSVEKSIKKAYLLRQLPLFDMEKSINFPISQRNWKFKNTKNKFYINFWKKAWGGKDKFP